MAWLEVWWRLAGQMPGGEGGRNDGLQNEMGQATPTAGSICVPANNIIRHNIRETSKQIEANNSEHNITLSGLEWGSVVIRNAI